MNIIKRNDVPAKADKDDFVPAGSTHGYAIELGSDVKVATSN